MCRGTKSPTHNLPNVFFPTRNAVTLFHDLNRRCTREVVRTSRRRLRAQDFMLRHCLAPACHAAFAVPERRHRRVTTLQSSLGIAKGLAHGLGMAVGKKTSVLQVLPYIYQRHPSIWVCIYFFHMYTATCLEACLHSKRLVVSKKG